MIDVLAEPAAPGVRSRGFGGWYGLESYRITERITQPAGHHPHDTAAILVVPGGGLIPGLACHVCGTLACAPGRCPHQPPAVYPVPDLLEEMAAAALDDAGEVGAVRDPPSDVAARPRFPLAPVPGA